MIINNNSVEQINIALLDLEKKLLTIKDDKSIIGSLKDSVNTIKASLNETKAGLTSGATYDINITGNATTATTATTAGSAVSAESAERAATADKATSADISKTEDPVNGDELQIGTGFPQHITNAKHAATADKATTADKAVEVVDYGDTSRTVRIGCSGPSVTADKLEYLAGYTEKDGNSVKLKDVDRAEVIKWLGIPTIRYADYRTESLTFSSLTDQKIIDLSKFGPGVTEDNVLSFMVIYWSKIHIIAQGDWAKSQGTGASGLTCALHSLNNGTGWCVIRCVYLA